MAEKSLIKVRYFTLCLSGILLCVFLGPGLVTDGKISMSPPVSFLLILFFGNSICIFYMEKDKRKMKKVSFGLLFVAIVVCICFMARPMFKIKDGNSREVYSRAYMHNIALSMQMTIGEGGREPPDKMDELVQWLDDDIADHLRESDILRDGLLCDSWGNPFVLDYPEPNNYVITSWGENKHYNGGEEDDLVYSFDPLN